MSEMKLRAGTDRFNNWYGTDNLAPSDKGGPQGAVAMQPEFKGSLDINQVTPSDSRRYDFEAQPETNALSSMNEMMQALTLQASSRIQDLTEWVASSVVLQPPAAPTTRPSDSEALKLQPVPVENPPAAAPAPPPKKKKKKGLFGRLFGGIAEAVGSVVSSVTSIVAKYNPASLLLSATSAAAKAVGLKGVAKALDKVNDVTRKVITEVGAGVKAVVKGALTGDFKDADNWWKANSSYVIMAASAVAMLVPGLQPLAIGLAVYQGFQGGKMVVEGIKSGDWKQAALGLVSVAGAVAGGALALGAKAISSTTTAIADTANKVADYTKKAVAVFDGIKNKDYGALVSVAAGTLGAGAELLGKGMSAFAEKAGDVAEKAAGYLEAAHGTYKAFQSGDVTGGLSGLLGLVSSAAGSKLNEQQAKVLADASRYVGDADSLAKAVKSGDIDEALALINRVAKREGITQKDVIPPGKVKLAGTIEDLGKALKAGDLKTASELIKEFKAP